MSFCPRFFKVDSPVNMGWFRILIAIAPQNNPLFIQAHVKLTEIMYSFSLAFVYTNKSA